LVTTNNYDYSAGFNLDSEYRQYFINYQFNLF